MSIPQLKLNNGTDMPAIGIGCGFVPYSDSTADHNYSDVGWELLATAKK